MLDIYYFSGTGNAHNVASWMIHEAELFGLSSRLIDISGVDSKDVISPAKNTLIGFISPTHGFHFPGIMRRFIRRFPKGNGISVFIVNTRAGLRVGKVRLPGLSGVTHYWAVMMLKSKGYKIVGAFPVDLPSNWLFLHPAVRKRGVHFIFERVEPKIRNKAVYIYLGGKSYNAFYDILQDLLISPLVIGYTIIGRYVFAKSFIASSDCYLCRCCEHSCPVKAISEKSGRLFWTLRCESCMRCMNNCPEQAIHTAQGFIVMVGMLTSGIISLYLDPILSLAGFADLQVSHSWWFRLSAFSIAFLLLLIPAYRAVHWLMRFSLVENLIMGVSLSSYRFWGRYKAPKPGAEKLSRDTHAGL